jgi:hypothetical protein
MRGRVGVFYWELDSVGQQVAPPNINIDAFSPELRRRVACQGAEAVLAEAL